MAAGIGGASVGVAGASSLTSTQSSPQLLFVMFGFYQLLLVMLLLRFRFPEEFLDYFKPFSIVTLNFSFLERIPGVKWFTDRFSFDSPGEVELSRIGIEDNSFLSNYLSTIIFLLFMILLHSFLYSIYICMKSSFDDDRNKVKNKLRKQIGEFFWYNFYLEFFLEASMLVNLVAVYNILNYDFSSYWAIASLSVSAIWIIFYFFFFWQITYRVWWFNSEKEMDGRYRTLYSGLEYSRSGARHFYMVFLIRRAFLIGIILGIKNPYIQAASFTLSHLIYLLYLLTTYPYKLKVDNLNCAVVELGYLVNLILVFFLPTLDDSEDKDPVIPKQGFVMMIVVMASTNLAIMFSVINSVSSCFKKKKKDNEKKTKVVDITNVTIQDQDNRMFEENKTVTNKAERKETEISRSFVLQRLKSTNYVEKSSMGDNSAKNMYRENDVSIENVIVDSDRSGNLH